MKPIFLYITDNFYVGTYGVLIAIGVIFAVIAILRRTKQLNLSPDFIYDIAFYMILAGIVGSRLLFVIVNYKDFFASPVDMLFGRQGFVFLGGFIAALFTGLYLIRKYKYPVLAVTDNLIPSVPLAHFFGRLGCFFAGCCYGRVCSKGWEFLGVKFPAVYDKKEELIGSFAYVDHLQHHLIEEGAANSLPVYPTQLFEAFGNLIIFIILTILYKKRKFDGQITAYYLIFYSVLRFSIEFLRGDAERGVWFGIISTSQILTLIAAVAGIIILKNLKYMKLTLKFDNKYYEGASKKDKKK